MPSGLPTLLLLGTLALAMAPAQAAPINEPIPTNAYITHAGLDWAWGGPCAYGGECSQADLSYQSTLGWRLPTLAELGALPTDFATYFRFDGANAPDGGTEALTGAYFSGSPGGDAACATAWFDTAYTHCDWGDGALRGWAGLNTTPYADQLFVRAATVDAPEPTAIALFALGSCLLVAARRRRDRPGATLPDHGAHRYGAVCPRHTAPGS